MIDQDRFRELFDGPTSAALLRAQLAALDAYERWLSSGALEGSSVNSMMNDMIKAMMDAQITLLKSTGQAGDGVRGLQREWIEAYRTFLETAIAEQDANTRS